MCWLDSHEVNYRNSKSTKQARKRYIKANKNRLSHQTYAPVALRNLPKTRGITNTVHFSSCLCCNNNNNILDKRVLQRGRTLVLLQTWYHNGMRYSCCRRWCGPMGDNKRRAEECTYYKIARNMTELLIFAQSYVILELWFYVLVTE